MEAARATEAKSGGKSGEMLMCPGSLEAKDHAHVPFTRWWDNAQGRANFDCVATATATATAAIPNLTAVGWHLA